MKSILYLMLTVYAYILLLICGMGSWWIYQKVQSPLGHVFYYACLPILVFIYVLFYPIYCYLSKKINISARNFVFLIFIKLAESMFYLSLMAFVLFSYFWIKLIILSKIMHLFWYLYLCKQQIYPSIMLKPSYDLIVLAILAIFIAIAPKLNSLTVKFTVAHIDQISNGLLFIAFTISILSLIHAIYLYRKPTHS